MTPKKFIISNDLVWEVLNVEEVKYEMSKRGCIEDWFKGRKVDWLIPYTDYHVTVRHKKEAFDRIFVLNEQEATKILFE